MNPTQVAPEISIIVPTFNEAANVAPFIAAISNAMSSGKWEIIFVDDDSPDGTWQIAKTLGQSDSRIRVIRRMNRRGLAGACIEGVLSSTARIIVVMDADFQHDETILPQLIAPIENDEADLMIGTREESAGDQGFSARRARGSRMAGKMARLALQFDVSDPMSGYFAMKRSLFEDLAPSLSTSGFKILLDILMSAPATLRVHEVNYTFRSRQAGASKFDARAMLDFIALLVHKASNGLIPSRFLLFSAVGASGVIVHFLALRAGLSYAGLSFGVAQTLATIVAMTCNFSINNVLTYQDLRLRGVMAVKGLLKFYLVCGLGAVANIGAANWVFGMQQQWFLSGLVGVIVGSIFNFNMSTAFVWTRAARAKR